MILFIDRASGRGRSAVRLNLRLMALLHELVREKGNRGAAQTLGIDPRTVASCMKTGRFTWRVREALEQGLQSGAGSAAARQRKRNDALEGRIEELEEKLRSGLEAVMAAVAGEVKALLEEQAKAMRHVERRLVRLEAARGARDVPETATEAEDKPVVKPRWRLHRELVTQEPEPGEEQVYDDATPVIIEWRKARAEFLKTLKTGTVLDRTEAKERMLKLEIAIIEEHELTLPPASYPWDRFEPAGSGLGAEAGPQSGAGGAEPGAAAAGGCAASSPWGCGGSRSTEQTLFLTGRVHNSIVVYMIPQFSASGLLPPGVHWADWNELADRFGNNPWRQHLITGLKAALENLKGAGCQTVYLNGSFVTSKAIPNDYDTCWEEAGVEPEALDPVLLTFDPGRAIQKAKYMGELFPASIIAGTDGLAFLEFFQTDKDTGRPKGIIAIDLGGLT